MIFCVPSWFLNKGTPTFVAVHFVRTKHGSVVQLQATEAAPAVEATDTASTSSQF
jgi:hypothetical protein